MTKAYMFDMDGTLIDSMGYFAQGMLAILDEDGIEYPEDIMNVITPLGLEKTAEYYIEMGVKGTKEEIVARMAEKFIRLYREVITLKPYVKEYLLSLKAEGKPLYVLSASPHITVDACLKANGIFDWFNEVWSTDDFGITKSSPQIFLDAAERIGCAPNEIKYFEDNIIALVNAQKAGLDTVGVYDEHYNIPEKEVAGCCNTYIHSFKEVLF